MLISCFECNAEPSRVDKAEYLIAKGILDGTLKNGASMLTPVILIDTSATNQPPAFNYCAIGYFGRFYFVTEIKNVRNNLWELYLRCDVLMTYADSIKKLNAYIARQENSEESYLIDSEVASRNKPTVEIKALSQNYFNNQLTSDNTTTGLYIYTLITV